MHITELFEAREADLYHGTSLGILNAILRNDIIKARSTVRPDSIPSTVRGYQRTISFSRDPAMSANFAKSRADGTGPLDKIPVLLVVDQNKLHRAVGKRLQPYNDLALNRDRTERSLGGSESEEVVFGDITNASSFIKKIIIHIPSNTNTAMLADLANSSIINDPRVVIADFLDKTPLTGRQFMNIVHQQS